MAKYAQQEKERSMEELEQQYNTITTLYDYAEDLVSTVESDLVKDPEAQLGVVEPLIADISDAADVLADEFILIAESKKQKVQSRASKKRVEAALRKLYMGLNDYQQRVHDKAKKAHGAIMNIADPIVKKIKEQVEKVVVIFMEFIEISLQSLMNHADLEELRQRNTKIAMMMHQHAMGQQQ